ncbi:MAG: hypothetical protein IJ870_01145 [Alphaproteobacteria bacterium]|nr:hypothetical protein [Alphaproteobacteria bacterium]
MKKWILISDIILILAITFPSGLFAAVNCSKKCNNYCCEKLIQQSDNVYYDDVEEVLYTFNIQGQLVEKKENTYWGPETYTYKYEDSKLSSTHVETSYGYAYDIGYIYDSNDTPLPTSAQGTGRHTNGTSSFNYTFNTETGVVESAYCSDCDGGHPANIVYVYDGNKLLSETITNLTFNTANKYDYVYDEENNIIQETNTKFENGKIADYANAITITAFDVYANPISETIKDSSGEINSTSSNSYTYDEAGHRIGDFTRITQSKYCMEDGQCDVFESKDVMTPFYTADGKLSYYAPSKSFNTIYTYDADGKLIAKTEGLYENDEYVSTTYTYEYDLSGRQIVYLDGKKIGVFDKDGNPYQRRIYTIEEAAAISKPTGNTFKLRYK